MSSEGSVSRLRQLGLYRSIDARTEEFLRLSRRRQIKQGCVCAAISTAVTVTVVIIVLLICEYMVVVETNTVQNIKKVNLDRKTKDSPVADKLDRSDFGFDQDYFEKMPLLLNALQDNSYIDPTAEMSVLIRKGPHFRHHNYQATTYPPTKTIRKSSPQPFLFEHRNPYPRPFRKEATTSNSWSESYHNAQRLKNLNDVVKYLEKTLNAKFGELYIPSESQVDLSSLYVAPTTNQRHSYPKNLEKGSRFKEYWNHHIDPLFSFKPENPSDVNFLVDDSKLYFISRKKSFPRTRYIARKCIRRNCEIYEPNQRVFNYKKINSDTNMKTENQKNIDPNKITITTNRPLFQFRRKTYKPKSPQTFVDNRQTKDVQESQIKIQKERPGIPQLILRLNLYSLTDTDSDKVTSSTPQSVYKTEEITTPRINNYVTENINQLEIDATSVEDFHIGSSGVIPITQPVSPPTYRITTPIVIPDLSVSEQLTTVPTTSLPEIFKFNAEDAKIPDQYLNPRPTEQPPIFSTDFRYLYEENPHQEKNNNPYTFNNVVRKSDMSLTTYRYDIENQSKSNEDKSEEENLETLIVKLKNSISSTTLGYKDEDRSENATETYVPQLNGHYRNMKHKNLSALLKESSERYRKRLENLTIIKRPYVPMLRDGEHNATDLFRR